MIKKNIFESQRKIKTNIVWRFSSPRKLRNHKRERVEKKKSILHFASKKPCCFS